MPDMNLRRGLFRLWIAASLLWLIAYVAYLWSRCIYMDTTDGTMLWCWSGEGDWVGSPRYFLIAAYARLFAIAVSVPLGMLIVGYALAWIVRGFQQSK
jgi:hypothetical protein